MQSSNQKAVAAAFKVLLLIAVVLVTLGIINWIEALTGSDIGWFQNR